MYVTSRFTKDGVPQTGLSPTISIYQVTDNSLVVNAQAMTEIGAGWYKYSFAGYSVAQDYVFACDGGATLSGSERYPGGATSIEGETTQILADVTGLDGDAMRGTDGAYTGTPPTVEAIRTELDANSTQLAAIVADTNELQTNQGNWLTATGFAVPGDEMALTSGYDAAKTAASQTSVTDMATALARILGLVQENYYLDQPVYTSGKLTSARMRTYTVAASVGSSSDVLATYTVTATWSGDNLLTYKVAKI
jgi:hypothetical protein